MASLADLNSYSSTDTDLTVQDLIVVDNEGANVRMPLMSWTPIHDIGPLTGNGVQITHTFQPGNVIMSDGTIYTPAEYANVVIDKPSTAVSGNVTVVNTPIKFATQSIKFDPYNTNFQPTVLVNMSQSAFDISGDFCAELWIYPITTSSNYAYPMVYAREFTNTPEFAYGYQGSLQRFVIDGLSYVSSYPSSSWLGSWHHVAIVRRLGQVRFFIDGVLQITEEGGPTIIGPSISSVPSTTDLSHITEYFRIGNKSRASTWGFPDLGINAYIDSVRFSNVARYTTTNAIAVPTQAWTTDVNTVFLIGTENNQVVDLANTYALNRVLEVPTVALRGGRANVTLSNPSTNVYQIQYIHDPEDYLAADTYLDFARDYSGVGNPDTPGVLTWSTRIRNLDVATYDYVYNVTLKLENTREVTNTLLADVPYDVYGNTLSDVNNVLTLFNDTTQTTQIDDGENPDSDGYYVTITTQDHPYNIQLSSTTVANVQQTWGYANGVPGGNGLLTITGTKSNINDALLNLQLIKNSAVTVDSTDRPTSRNMVGRLYTVSGITPPGGVSETFATTGITTNQTTAGPSSSINYCVIPNNQDNQVGTNQSLNLIIPNLATSVTVVQDSSWNGCSWDNIGDATHEFWIWIDDATKKCNIHVSEICLSLYNNKLWMAWDPKIPGIYYADTVANRPRRIEHNQPVSSGTWYHIAMVRQSGTFKFYVNGVSDSTVYTTGNTTVSAANAANGFTTAGSAYWHYGGYIPMFNTAPGWRLPGFAGRLAQIRWSKTTRYTTNFTPSNRPFFNDPFTLYLHQFNTTLAQDDNQLPSLRLGRNQFTWQLGHVDGQPTTLTQDYYAQFSDPLYNNLDVNYVVPTTGRYRVAYAGKDSLSNPVFVYGFRDDAGGLTTRVNKIDAATGNILFGPTQQLSNSVSLSTVQVLTNNESVNLRETLITPNVPIAISQNNGCLTGNINLENGFITLTGSVGTGQSSVAEVMPYNFKSSNSVVWFGCATANATASMFDNRAMPLNLTSVVATNANIATELNMVGFPGITQDRVIKLALGLHPTNYAPTYNLTLSSNSTNPSLGNFGSGVISNFGTGQAQQYKVRLIAINQDRTSTNTNADNRFLYCIRNRDIIGTSNERILLAFRAGRCDDAGTPYIVFGTEIAMYTGPTNPQTDPINVRVGGFDIVPGATKNKAWLIYNREFTNTGFPQGVSNNTAAGLWYMGINISDSYNVTFDAPVQYIDPEVSGAIYRPSLAAQSATIGGYTYIHAVVGSASGDQPYPVSIRIPN